jgi:hypothetical protein
MGKMQDMLDKILIVEAQGFDPLTETYSSRIGQLDAAAVTTTEVTPSGVERTTAVVDPTDQRAAISETFVQSGLEDPFAGLVQGERVEPSRISTPFNLAQQDTTLGSPQQIIDQFNQFYLPPEEQIEVTKEGTLKFPEPQKPITEKPTEVNVNFSKSYNAQTREYTYKRENEKTGEVYEVYEDPVRFQAEAKVYREGQKKSK